MNSMKWRSGWAGLGLVLLLVVSSLGALSLFAGPRATAAGSASVSGSSIQPGDADCTDKDLSSNCKIMGYLVVFINVLSAMVGVVVVGSIVVGGIQYSTAADDPQKIAAAKGRIYNALLALVAFIFSYAFLQWIIPGGVLN